MDLPIEYNTQFSFFKLKSGEYEWDLKKIINKTISHANGHNAVNIWSSYNFDNIRMSLSEYISLFESFIDAKVNKTLMINLFENARQYFRNFLDNYIGHKELQEYYNNNITQVMSNFITDKLGIKIKSVQSYYNIHGRSSVYIKENEQYILINTNSIDKVIIIELIFAQKSFVSRFVVTPNNDTYQKNTKSNISQEVKKEIAKTILENTKPIILIDKHNQETKISNNLTKLCIYVLELEGGNYYVGKTRNPIFRLENHIESKGSGWTKKYKPVKIVELIENCDDYDEDKITLKYMSKYGIHHVRGGSFSQVTLDDDTIKTLEKMIMTTKDVCYLCGCKGHFAKQCEYTEKKYTKDKKPTVYCCSYCKKEFKTYKGALFHENVHCKLNKNKRQYESEDDTEEETEEETEEDDSSDDICYRCGRDGHYANECYAMKHIRGYKLN